jgi:hypothetical protein
MMRTLCSNYRASFTLWRAELAEYGSAAGLCQCPTDGVGKPKTLDARNLGKRFPISVLLRAHESECARTVSNRRTRCITFLFYFLSVNKRRDMCM